MTHDIRSGILSLSWKKGKDGRGDPPVSGRAAAAAADGCEVTAARAATSHSGPAYAIDGKSTEPAGGLVCYTTEGARGPLQITKVDSEMLWPSHTWCSKMRP